jgi:hypothetical protein
MNFMWSFITPSRLGGVNSTGMFCDGIRDFAESAGFRACAEAMDVRQAARAATASGVGTATAVEFISEGLRNDQPIAFLNLDNGSEKQLDRWHWVTVVAIEFPKAEGRSQAELTEVEGRSQADSAATGFSGAEGGIPEGRIIIEVLDNCRFIKVDLKRWMETTSKGGGFVRFRFNLRNC